MKLCANLSLLFNEVPLLERFDASRRAGFGAVEIQFPYDTTLDDLQAALCDTRQKLALINVPAGDFMSGGEGLASVPERRSQFNEAVSLCEDYAGTLQAEHVNVLSGRCLDEQFLPAYWQVFRENLKLVANRMARHGVIATFEAINTHDMPACLVHRAAHLWETLSILRHSNLRAQYDVYHMSRMGENVLADLQARISSIGHIQFADVPGRGEPGTGTLDFAIIFATIREAHYRGYVSAEYWPSESTQASLGWLKLAAPD